MSQPLGKLGELGKWNDKFGKEKREKWKSIWRRGSFGCVEKGERLNESSGTSEVVSSRRAIKLEMLSHHGWPLVTQRHLLGWCYKCNHMVGSQLIIIISV